MEPLIVQNHLFQVHYAYLLAYKNIWNGIRKKKAVQVYVSLEMDQRKENTACIEKDVILRDIFILLTARIDAMRAVM